MLSQHRHNLLPQAAQRAPGRQWGWRCWCIGGFRCVFLEGVYLDRADQGRTPLFVTGEAPTDTDIAAVVQTIRRRVIRTLRRLGYLVDPPPIAPARVRQEAFAWSSA